MDDSDDDRHVVLLSFLCSLFGGHVFQGRL